MVILGEVYTGLVRNSTAVPHEAAAQLLALVVGEQVRQTRRPMPAAVSPTQLTGIDCQVTGRSGAGTRVVGTVESRAVLTGGRVLQGSAFVRLTPGRNGHRLPWSHYLARPGLAETLGRYRTEDLAAGFLEGRTTADLDLGAIAMRTAAEANSADILDHRASMKVAPTRIRWVAAPQDTGDTALEFHSRTADLRTMHLRLPPAELVDVAGLCEVVAVHDWLLTAQQYLLERYATRSGEPAEGGGSLRSAVELLHLWMPEARLSPMWLSLWKALDRVAGMTPQWNTSVNRIRDALSLALLDASVAAKHRAIESGSR